MFSGLIEVCIFDPPCERFLLDFVPRCEWFCFDCILPTKILLLHLPCLSRAFESTSFMSEVVTETKPKTITGPN